MARVWQPNVVAQQVQQVQYVPQTVTEQVPVQVTRYQSEQVVRKVPYQTCRIVQQEVVRKVPYTVSRPVVEHVERKVPVQVYRMVTEEQVRKVPYQTCRMVQEERVEQVPTQVCRMAPYEETVRIPARRGEADSGDLQLHGAARGVLSRAGRRRLFGPRVAVCRSSSCCDASVGSGAALTLPGGRTYEPAPKEAPTTAGPSNREKQPALPKDSAAPNDPSTKAGGAAVPVSPPMVPVPLPGGGG